MILLFILLFSVLFIGMLVSILFTFSFSFFITISLSVLISMVIWLTLLMLSELKDNNSQEEQIKQRHQELFETAKVKNSNRFKLIS